MISVPVLYRNKLFLFAIKIKLLLALKHQKGFFTSKSLIAMPILADQLAVWQQSKDIRKCWTIFKSVRVANGRKQLLTNVERCLLTTGCELKVVLWNNQTKKVFCKKCLAESWANQLKIVILTLQVVKKGRPI